MGFAYGFSSVWVLRMSFHLYGFCVWVFICMDFAYEFSSVDFHLWGFFFAEYASEVCERSMRAKYASEAFF
jgi:hypothetical protein